MVERILEVFWEHWLVSRMSIVLELYCMSSVVLHVFHPCNIHRWANSEPLVAIGLNLVMIVLECGSSHLCSSPGLAALVQDNLCKYLFKVVSFTSEISCLSRVFFYPRKFLLH